ncbi:MAG: hypothetical protein HPY52_00285 [Firmicutes bacterium]|nr:hypothetical protein [Bacillota bacterium]
MSGRVDSITVSKDKICFAGGYGKNGEVRGAWFKVYAFEPCAAVPHNIDPFPAPIATIPAECRNGSFQVAVDRFRDKKDGIYCRYKLAVSDSGDSGLSLLSGVCYPTELDGIALYNYAYPAARTIKGLQVRMIDDAIALRTAYYAARKKYSEARVYISLDHFWTLFYQDNPLRCYPGKKVLDILNGLALQEGNFDWSVAYHPYPEDLSRPDFWNDKTAVHSFDAGRITFCLAYRKVEKTPGIESFILHAHVDNRDEFGLNLGLWRRDKESDDPSAPGSPKPIYYIFKDIDGPKGEEACRFAREVVGEEKWAEILGEDQE